MTGHHHSTVGASPSRTRLISGLVHPPDRGTVDGRFVLFVWDWRDVAAPVSHSRIVVKRRSTGQSHEEAFERNEVAFETEVEFDRFLSLDVARLGEPASDYVWRVFAQVRESDGGLRPVAFSELRSFSLIGARLDLDWVTSAPPPGDAVEGPIRPRPGAASACPNGDLEMGTLAGWTAYSGSRSGSAIVNWQPGIIPGRHDIVTAGFDPTLASVGVNLPQVNEGVYAVRLGNATGGGLGDALTYTFTVNAQNKNFGFRYALVLEDPGHVPEEQPFFSYVIFAGNMPILGRQIVADRSSPFFKSVGAIVYRDWTPVCIDLSDFIGESLRIVFAVADCAFQQHSGHAYIDGLCLPNAAVAAFTMPSEICASDELIADGTASSGETSHFWSIEESDADWGRNPETEVSQWFIGHGAGPINLTAFYASRGKAFKCGTYYRIKLAVNSDCVPWNESVQLLYARCPTVKAGPDACVSCVPDGGTTRLGVGPHMPAAGFSYAWTPSAGLDNTQAPRPVHTHGSVDYPITYTLTVTDPAGCTASQSVTLYCRPPTVSLSMRENCCSVTLNAHASNYASIQWSTGQTGVESIVVTQPGTYSVAVSNPCASATDSIVVPASQGLSGPFNPVAAESKVGSAPLPDAMHIKDVVIGSPAGIAGVPNAYNATDYELLIFDRWGQIVKTVTDSNCQGFANWSIAWDTTDNWGSAVPQGTYTWRLRFKNCERDWTLPSIRRFKARTCIKWATLFGVKLWCREYDVAPGTTEDVPGGIDSVTVVR